MEDNPMPVHEVLATGTKQEIFEMLKRKIHSKCISNNGDTVLHSVLRNSKLIDTNVIEILTQFLNQDVDPNIKNNCQETALHLAVERRMKSAVNCLLKFAADIHVVNNCGDSIAHFFIEDEYEKCKKSLLYPIMNTPENRNVMENCSVKFLEFLLYNGVTFDDNNHRGVSALQLAFTRYLLHILPTLLTHSNRMMFRDSDKEILLQIFLDENIPKSHLLDQDQYPGYYSESFDSVINFLTSSRLPEVPVDEYDCTPVYTAIREKSEMGDIEKLINDYLYNCAGKDEATTLFNDLARTCEWWNNQETDYYLTVLADLIHRGADVNSNLTVQKKIVTAAVTTINLPLLNFLEENGADFRFELKYGESLLHLLAKQKYYQDPTGDIYNGVCNLLVGSGCKSNATDERGKSVAHAAAAYGNVVMMRKLIELGADVNCRDDSSRTPLHEAVMMNESLELINLLIKSGADVNAADSNGEKPLDYAIFTDNVELVRLLIEHGATVDHEDKCWRTPLHRAVSNDAEVEMIELLLSSGADVNAKDLGGDTPLHSAVANDNVAIVRLLIENGALVSVKDKHKHTPLQSAEVNEKSAEIVELLSKALRI